MDGVTRQCKSCGYIHPAPWDDACRVGKETDDDEKHKEVYQFIQRLTDYLVKQPNASEIMKRITKAVNEGKN